MELPNQEIDIILKEYGRNVQNIVAYILKIEDRDLRTKYAVTCIELMRQINPNIKDTQEHYSKLWDQLYIISNFQLDVDSPHPMPERAAIGKKPSIVAYNSNKLYYKHYGRNIELVIQKAIEMEDPEEKEAAIIYLGRTMKKFYSTWNKENVEDELIISHIKEMSKGKLQVDEAKVKAQGLFDTNEKLKPQGANSSGNNYSNNGNGGSSGYGTVYEAKTNNNGSSSGYGNNNTSKYSRNNQNSGGSVGDRRNNRSNGSGGGDRNNNNRFKRK
ncbi:MAG TPA: DUF4290 domain-containing protein [Cytophagaceae bacterium]|jgi:hypothetical protein|nr:DUF4290 domain-containing protein [Cytophagaceae bacterium]